MRRGKAIAWTLVLGLVAWALAGRGLVNYDTLYALVWGRDLTRGTHARLRRPARADPAPAGHARRRDPRAARRRRRTREAIDATIVLAFICARRRWPGSPTASARRGSIAPPAPSPPRSSSPAARCSTSARAHTSTSLTSCSSSARCSSRRAGARAGAPVLALLAVAGLHPPGGVAVLGRLLSSGCAARATGAYAALAAAAPVIWGLTDLHHQRRPAALAHRYA